MVPGLADEVAGIAAAQQQREATAEHIVLLHFVAPKLLATAKGLESSFRSRLAPAATPCSSLSGFVALSLVRVIANSWLTTRRMAGHPEVCLLGCSAMGGHGVGHCVQRPALGVYLQRRGMPMPPWVWKRIMAASLCISVMQSRLVDLLAVHTVPSGQLCASSGKRAAMPPSLLRSVLSLAASPRGAGDLRGSIGSSIP